MTNSKEEILFIKANPIDTPQLKLETEEKRIREALSRCKDREKFNFQSRGAVTVDLLLDYLLELKPNILHISGHGGDDNTLFLEDNDGYKIEIPIQQFCEFLSNFLIHVKCVFLNSCHSLCGLDDLEHKIPNLIGMKKEIADDVAIDFSAAFYRSLFSGKTIKESFKIALDRISLISVDDSLIPIFLENINENQDGNAVLNDPVNNSICDKLISIEEIDHFKKQKINSNRNYSFLIILFFVIAITAGTTLYFFDQGLLTTLASTVVPVVFGVLPFVEISKNKERIELIDFYKLKRKRLVNAITIVTSEDVKSFNEEFFKIMTL